MGVIKFYTFPIYCFIGGGFIYQFAYNVTDDLLGKDNRYRPKFWNPAYYINYGGFMGLTIGYLVITNSKYFCKNLLE